MPMVQLGGFKTVNQSISMSKYLMILLFLFGIVYAQQDSCIDTINLRGNWLMGYEFKYGCWDFSKVQKLFELNQNLTGILKSDSLSSKFIKPAEPFNNIGILCGMVGGFLFGWNLGQAMAGNTVSSNKWVISGSLIAVDVSFELIGYSFLKKAIHQYNKGGLKKP